MFSDYLSIEFENINLFANCCNCQLSQTRKLDNKENESSNSTWSFSHILDEAVNYKSKTKSSQFGIQKQIKSCLFKITFFFLCSYAWLQCTIFQRFSYEWILSYTTAKYLLLSLSVRVCHIWPIRWTFQQFLFSNTSIFSLPKYLSAVQVLSQGFSELADEEDCIGMVRVLRFLE